MRNEIDEKIINLLLNEGRMPINEIAKKCGSSEATVRNRIASLIEKRVIIGYKARIRPGNGMAQIIIGIDVLPEEYVHIMEELKSNPDINELYRTSGDHSMVAIANLSGKDPSLLIKDIEKINGVKKVFPAFVQEAVK
ncbi:MAG: Lrp/AsnC family transcriptional regulator [Candidatus Micrarchaeaceae archaeon]